MSRRSEIYVALSDALERVRGSRSSLDEVGEIPDLEAAIELIVAERVAAARAEGLSWHAIAQQLGISRQAAHKRFGKQKRPSGIRIELKRDRKS